MTEPWKKIARGMAAVEEELIKAKMERLEWELRETSRRMFTFWPDIPPPELLKFTRVHTMAQPSAAVLMQGIPDVRLMLQADWSRLGVIWSAYSETPEKCRWWWGRPAEKEFGAFDVLISCAPPEELIEILRAEGKRMLEAGEWNGEFVYPVIVNPFGWKE